MLRPEVTTLTESKILVVTDLVRKYGSFTALNNVNLQVSRGERIVICGPSGSGKSTLIRCINRIEAHDSGRIVVDGMELTGRAVDVTNVRSEVGMVFQSFNLFPHLSVVENCMLAPDESEKMPSCGGTKAGDDPAGQGEDR